MIQAVIKYFGQSTDKITQENSNDVPSYYLYCVTVENKR